MGSGPWVYLVAFAISAAITFCIIFAIFIFRMYVEQAKLIRDLADRLSAKNGVIPISGGEMPPYMTWNSNQVNDEGLYDPISMTDEDIIDMEEIEKSKKRSWPGGGDFPPPLK